jgi:hypothetical protein
MTDRKISTLDANTRDVILGALLDGQEPEPVSDEDLAVLAESGMEPFDEDHRDRLIYAMCKDVGGSSGTLDVFRLLDGRGDFSVRPDDRSSDSSRSPIEPTGKQFWFGTGSRMLAGVWAVAACMALYFGVLSSSTTEPNTTIEQPMPHSSQGLTDQEGVSESIQELLRELTHSSNEHEQRVTNTDQGLTDQAMLSERIHELLRLFDKHEQGLGLQPQLSPMRRASDVLLGVSLAMLIVIPPAMVLYRHRQSK